MSSPALVHPRGSAIRPLEHDLECYLDPAPGDRLFDECTQGAGVALPLAGTWTDVLAITIDIPRPLFIRGISTSPTGLGAFYRLTVDGEQILQLECQPTADLWTLYPVRLVMDRGPTRIQIQGADQTGAGIAAVYARVAGWVIAGEPLDRRRLKR